MAEEYKIGRGRPPLATRWEKGISGNPSGRRKGSRNARTVWRDAMAQLVKVKVNGRLRTMTRREALILKLLDNAAGDRKTLETVLKLDREFLGIEIETDQEFDVSDGEILENYVRRRQAGGGDE
jgi:hypothetical protein